MGVFDEIEQEYRQSQGAAKTGNVFDELEADYKAMQASKDSPVADKALSMMKKNAGMSHRDFMGTIAPYARPVAEYGGLALGGLLGGASGAFGLNPASVAAGAALGGGLGYAGGRNLANTIDEMAGLRQPQTVKNALINTGSDIVEGGMMELGGQMVGPALNMFAKPAGKVGRALYEHVMKIPPSVPAAEREIAITEGLKGGYNITKKGLKGARGEIDNVNREIAGTIDSMTKAKGTIDMNKVVQRIDDLKAQFAKLPPDVAKKYLSPLDEMKIEFASAGFITPKRAQEMKQLLYRLNRDNYGEWSATLGGKQTIEGYKAVARGLKEELVKLHPELKRLNARDSDLIKLEHALERAVSRIGNRELLTYGDMVVSGLGAGTGYVTGGDTNNAGMGAITFPLLARLMKSPSIQGRVGIILDKVARKKAMQGSMRHKAPIYGVNYLMKGSDDE
jgi:hypothetical protein